MIINQTFLDNLDNILPKEEKDLTWQPANTMKYLSTSFSLSRYLGYTPEKVEEVKKQLIDVHQPISMGVSARGCDSRYLKAAEKISQRKRAAEPKMRATHEQSEATQFVGFDLSDSGDNSGVVTCDHNGMIRDSFTLPRSDKQRGTLVETLHGGQGLGLLGDLEYFQSKIDAALQIPKSIMQGTQHRDDVGTIQRDPVNSSHSHLITQAHHIMQAQLKTNPPPIVFKSDSEIGKRIIQEMRVTKFDDAMEII